MPPRQKQPRKELDNVFQVEEPEVKREKFNLGDSGTLKRALDEAVVEVVKKAGHQLDNSYTDVKTAVGLLACAVACLAQFYPQKYPANFWLLLGCVSAYVALSGLLTLIAVFEADAIAHTRAAPGAAALVVASKTRRFQDKYTLRMAARGSAASSDKVELEKSMGQYFDAEGYLVLQAIETDAESLLQRLQGGSSKTK